MDDTIQEMLNGELDHEYECDTLSSTIKEGTVIKKAVYIAIGKTAI